MPTSSHTAPNDWVVAYELYHPDLKTDLFTAIPDGEIIFARYAMKAPSMALRLSKSLFARTTTSDDLDLSNVRWINSLCRMSKKPVNLRQVHSRRSALLRHQSSDSIEYDRFAALGFTTRTQLLCRQLKNRGASSGTYKGALHFSPLP